LHGRKGCVGRNLIFNAKEFASYPLSFGAIKKGFPKEEIFELGLKA
jgi:hypothetical protein